MVDWLIKELEEFFKCLRSWIIVFFILFVFFLIFGIENISLFGRKIPLPFPSYNPLAAMFMKSVQSDLLPEGIEIIAVNPLNVFFVMIQIAAFLSFLISFPFFLYKIIAYISPALFKHEKKLIIKAILPSSLLFILGCLFSYFILIPLTFEFLYRFALVSGVKAFFEIGEFYATVTIITLAGGITFLLPIFMVILCQAGIVNPKFWKENWRYAIIAILIFTAVITPDTSGATMILLSAPIAVLYFLGYILSKKFYKV